MIRECIVFTFLISIVSIIFLPIGTKKETRLFPKRTNTIVKKKK